MSAAAGPGPVPVDVEDLPDGWEAFATNDAARYFCFPQIYYYCRKLDKVQWERPGWDDRIEEDYRGPTLNGRRPYEKGDELVPAPPQEMPYDGPYSDAKYKASCEDPNDVFQPDEDMLEACLDCDLEKLKKALDAGADVSLPNQPWLNTPLHLANVPFFWDAETIAREKELRLQLTRLLVNQGADLDAENIFHCRPLDFTVFHGYPATTAYLQQQGATFGITGAAYANQLDRVKELLQEGVDIDLEGRYRRTAFAEAHLRGHWRLESFLAQQGCSRELPHPEHLKFNPGGAAIPRGNLVPKREIQYHRDDNPEWYDDMMEKRFPGYAAKRGLLPKD